MINVAVFASGFGSNFEVLVKEKYENINICLLICDKLDAFVIERAKQLNIKTLVVLLKDFKTKEQYEAFIVSKLLENNIDFIVLAGYMKIIGSTLLKAYPNKIINIHPTLLPSFKGANGIKDAYDYGVKVFGVTVHYVDDGIDTGCIIDQEAFHVTNESLEEIEEKIHQIEHKLYVSVLKSMWEV